MLSYKTNGCLVVRQIGLVDDFNKIILGGHNCFVSFREFTGRVKSGNIPLPVSTQVD